VLLGRAGDDQLNGGSARGILNGGDGADRIVGNAGDDILIAGYTVHDADEAGLSAILAEWNSFRAYAADVSNIRGDASATQPVPCRFSQSTVFDDRDADQIDTLTGSAGQDWFWADRSAGEDKVSGLTSGEQIQEV
jgi:Ca2+-binding RTX toxin-like protein